jgi:hypothetical protein
MHARSRAVFLIFDAAGARSGSWHRQFDDALKGFRGAIKRTAGQVSRLIFASTKSVYMNVHYRTDEPPAFMQRYKCFANS